jgi:hypothetical protein
MKPRLCGEFIVKVTADANVFLFNLVYLTTLSVTQVTSVLQYEGDREDRIEMEVERRKL